MMPAISGKSILNTGTRDRIDGDGMAAIVGD